MEGLASSLLTKSFILHQLGLGSLTFQSILKPSRYVNHRESIWGSVGGQFLYKKERPEWDTQNLPGLWGTSHLAQELHPSRGFLIYSKFYRKLCLLLSMFNLYVNSKAPLWSPGSDYWGPRFLP